MSELEFSETGQTVRTFIASSGSISWTIKPGDGSNMGRPGLSGEHSTPR